MMTHHAEAETLAAFMDGNLDRDELDAVTAHLSECEECRAVLGEAAVFEEQETRISRRRWMAVAAAVVVVVAAASIGPSAWSSWRERSIERGTQAVFKNVPEGKRLAGRLTGQNEWREHKTLRGVDKSEKYSLQIAVAQLEHDVDKDTSPRALRARATAQAYDGKPGPALETLEQIPETARDAATWNDIAALRLQLERYDEAVNAADRALQNAPGMSEALFNRAKALYSNPAVSALRASERVPAIQKAIAAYEQYLKADSEGLWAKEAREDIARLRSDLREDQ